MDIRTVDDPPGSEPARIPGGIRHIVFMGQKDLCEASHPIEDIDKRFEIPRRIDQPVAVRMLHEETVRPERLFPN
jgi:hypothetical protein